MPVGFVSLFMSCVIIHVGTPGVLLVILCFRHWQRVYVCLTYWYGAIKGLLDGLPVLYSRAAHIKRSGSSFSALVNVLKLNTK